MSPMYELTNEEAEAVYLALTGVVNLPLLQKTKKALQDQRLFHAVEEVNERLRLFEGVGLDTVGLLRTFNPQHDMLAEGTPRPGSKSDKPKDMTRDMFLDNSGELAIALPSGHGAPLAQAWDDSIVPKPRPAKGHLVFMPSGQSLSIADVLGWDVERDAFRIVTADGWDGHIVSFGKRDAAEWRMLNQLLDYPDGSDFTKEPQGDPREIAHDLRALAAGLLAGPAHLAPDQFAAPAAQAIPMLDGVAPDHIAPDYVNEYVTRDMADMEDNAHALARLCEQYADSAAEPNAEGLDSVVAAAHENGAGDGVGDGLPFDGEPSTEWRSAALAPSTDDADDEQALADGSYEPTDNKPHQPGDRAESFADAQDASAEQREAEAVAAGVVADIPEPEPSAQRKRNAARAGTKAVSKQGKRGKRTS